MLPELSLTGRLRPRGWIFGLVLISFWFRVAFSRREAAAKKKLERNRTEPGNQAEAETADNAPSVPL